MTAPHHALDAHRLAQPTGISPHDPRTAGFDSSTRYVLTVLSWLLSMLLVGSVACYTTLYLARRGPAPVSKSIAQNDPRPVSTERVR